METIYNCHTHVFNSKCAPPGFYGREKASFISLLIYLPKNLSRWLNSLRRYNPLVKDDPVEKFANMLWIGSQKSQEEIFLDLLDKYSIYPTMKIVALSLDMDFMGGGKPLVKYNTQLWELFQLKAKYPYKIIPFLCIDPRRDTGKNLRKMVADYIEKKGFGGIKLYPALGYYPFNPNLNEVYKYAEDMAIPIITHCDTGGIYYQGKLTNEHLNPLGLDGKPYFPEPLTKQKIKTFKNNFTDPKNYLSIIKKYSNLKVCFAHFGGYESILKEAKALPWQIRIKRKIKSIMKKADTPSWYERIKEIIVENENVYADVSYTLFDKNTFDTLKNDIKNETIGEKILFGTDYYMTEKEKDEIQHIEDFKAFLIKEESSKEGDKSEGPEDTRAGNQILQNNHKIQNRDLFKIIATDNPKKFLTLNPAIMALYKEHSKKLILAVKNEDNTVSIKVDCESGTVASVSYDMETTLTVRCGQQNKIGKSNKLIEKKVVSFICIANNPDGNPITVIITVSEKGGNSISYHLPKGYTGSPAYNESDQEPSFYFKVNFIKIEDV